MSAPKTVLAAAIALSVSLSACHGRCRFVRSDDADFLLVRGEYSVIILHPEFAARAFGPDWSSQSLFYRTSYGIDLSGRPVTIAPGTLRPIAKGEPVLNCAGTDWSPQFFAVYSLEKAQFVGLNVDLRKATIRADAPVKPLYGRRATVLDDGTLMLHD